MESHRRDLLCAFERFAATAPHLLEDIGFRRNARLSSPERSIWEQDGMRIALEAKTGQAYFLPCPEAAKQL